MQSSSDFISKHHQIWETSSDDYLANVKRMERARSVFPDIPQYPNIHMIFNKKVTDEVEQEGRPKPRAPQARKKVQFVDQQEKNNTEYSDINENCKVVDESGNMEVDGFIQQKRKNFALCKWATFKAL